jgi:TRAP-type transport system periplasmic protein
MLRTIVATGLALAALASTAAQAVDLRFGFPAPPQSLVNQWGITPWVEDIKKDSNGALDIKVIPGPTLGTFGNIYDRTANGVADISFGIFSPLSARFPKTEVATVPFVAETPKEAALGLWRLYEQGLIADEFKDVKVLGLFAFGTPAFHMKDKEITRIDQIRGMKISAASRMESDVLALFGAAPQSAEPTEVYQGISRGLYEGILIPWSAFLTFKLAEVSKYHLDLPLGASGAFVAMNKNAYAKLPAAERAVLDKHSGEALSRRMGDAINRQDAFAREGARKLGNHTFHNISDEDRKIWAPKLQPVIDQWARNTPNGEAVLAAFRKEVAAVRAEK